MSDSEYLPAALDRGRNWKNAVDVLAVRPFTCTFFISFFMLLPFIFQGIDVTDPGFHLTNQTLFWDLKADYVLVQPFWWFSDVIGGVWLAGTDFLGLGMLGARLGGTLLFSLCAALAARIVCRRVHAHWLVVIAALAVAPFFASFLGLISYDYAPSLIALLFFLLYFQLIQRKPEGSLLLSAGALQAGFAGFLLLLAFFARITAGALLIFPLIVWLIALAVDRSKARTSLEAAAIVYTTFAVGFLVFHLLVLPAGYLSLLINPVSVQGSDYSLGEIFQRAWRQISHVFGDAYYVFGAIALIATAFRFPIPGRGFQTYAFYSLLALASALWLYSIIVDTNLYWDGLYNFSILSFLLVFILPTALATLHRAEKRNEIFWILVLTAAAYALCLMLAAGSFVTLWKAHYGAWLLVPLTVALMLLLSRNWERSPGAPARWFKAGAVALTGVVLTVSFYHLVFRGVQRDSLDRLSLDTPLTSAKLVGIFTTRARAESLDGVIAAIRARTKPGERILAYREVPMMYYATDTLPWANLAWFDHRTLEGLVRIEDTLCDAGKGPRVVVRSRVPMGHRDWGLKPDIKNKEPSRRAKRHERVDLAVERCGYEVEWQNIDFQVLVRS